MRKKNLREIFKAIIITFFIVLIVIGGAVISLSILKDEAIETNLKIADFHATTVSEQITQTFVNLDLLIKDLHSFLKTQEDIKLLKTKFANILSNNPYIRSINLLNSQKQIIYSSNQQNIGVEVLGENFYPKPLFNQELLRFGNPWIGRDFVDAKDVTLVKDVDKRSSNFLPIIKKIKIDNEDFFIAMSINSDYFINKYTTNLEKNFATLELIRTDGMLLFSSCSERKIGMQVHNSLLIEEAIQKNKSLGIETVEGKTYLASYKVTDMFPLNVVVGLDFLQTMTRWEEKRVLIIFIISLLVLFSMGLVFTLIYRYTKEKRHELEFQKAAHKTFKKAKEVAEKANKAKSDFLANMSHEIRTPLNGVIGLTALVLKSSLDEKQKDYLEKAQKSSNALLNLINDILDYSKIEAGKLSLEYRLFELDDVTQGIKDLFEYQANTRKISLEINAPTPLSLIGDSLRLEQILINIIGNALKFTKEGFVKLDISIKEEDKHNICLHFSVKDSGIGMSQKVQKNLFEEFTQADNSITREYGGTGLGLAISKQLVNLMDGTISLRSSLGVGSEFLFDITFAKADVLTKRDIVKEQMQDLEAQKFQSSHVLLVEDNTINQIVAVGTLEGLGLSVDIANNGKEAVEKVSTQEYDLIFMDLQMPVMDGFEATEKIRKFNHETPIIALSAAVMQEDKEKTKLAGMDAHLEKPINQEKLIQTIFKFLKEKDTLSVVQSFENDIQEIRIDFYGVDMQELTNRIGNKPQVIRQLLLNFCEEYSFVKDKLNVKDTESENFIKTIHALKGISGNLSLTTIYQLAKKIYESTDKTKKREFVAELILLVQETTKQLKTQLAEESFDNTVHIKYNKNEKETLIKEFIYDLEHFIVIVPNRVNILLQILQKQMTRQELQNIEDDLNHYRYQEASKKIKEAL